MNAPPLSLHPSYMLLRLAAVLPPTEDAMTRKTVELIHEGSYAAEVLVELIEDDTGWSPYLSLEDAKKLDAVRLALRKGEIAEAAKHGRVFELKPISV
jgi:hypothetical protein